MKVVIVCVSVAHGNTERVAEVMAGVLGARVVSPEEVDLADLDSCDLVGFGSRIFGMDFHPRLSRFVRELPEKRRRKGPTWWAPFRAGVSTPCSRSNSSAGSARTALARTISKRRGASPRASAVDRVRSGALGC